MKKIIYAAAVAAALGFGSTTWAGDYDVEIEPNLDLKDAKSADRGPVYVQSTSEDEGGGSREPQSAQESAQHRVLHDKEFLEMIWTAE
jgi:hypothetical protein